MIGDRLRITDYHRNGGEVGSGCAEGTFSRRRPAIVVTIAGESGSGKSEIAHCLAEALAAEGRSSVILGQDDYFKLPPRTNHARRLEEIDWVGPGEVWLDLLDAHAHALKMNETRRLKSAREL